MEIYNILKVHELEMDYTVDLSITLLWYDSRITFRNLKTNKDENILSMKEIDQIWSPELMFLDSDNVGIIKAGDQVSKDASKFSGKGSVRILRHGYPRQNPLLELDEDYLYPGKENALLMTNHMVVRLGCKFSLEMFPFDSQICPIKLNKDFEQMTQFGLEWYKVPKIQNSIKLMQFDIMKDLDYNNTNAIQNKIRVYIKLQRKLAGYIFKIYIPTLCLVMCACLTLFIDHTHFDATIMVALTTMLVMYTLEQSISATLPATVYLKMIDIWLFGGLIVPFIIIGVLVILDYKVIKESNDVIEMQKENDNKWSSKCFIKTMRIMLLVIVAFLVASYWIVGLTHYFT